MVKLANWQNEQNRKIWQNRKIHFSFFSFCQFANFTISFCQRNGQNGKIDKVIFMRDCQLLTTISFCQQNGQNGKIDKDIFHSAHSASLLTLPFHSAHSASLLTLPFRSAHSASLLTLPRLHSSRLRKLFKMKW